MFKVKYQPRYKQMNKLKTNLVHHLLLCHLSDHLPSKMMLHNAMLKSLASQLPVKKRPILPLMKAL